MTLKEELEILRGEPIQVFDGDPMDIPCIETSDPEKLCKHPVVSVRMITYNHEPYIRQAIEGVMMQKTDFEFELIIGEDCSQDKTREICFEYQKKYPDKIRVLWWHENVSKLGGNGRRVRARCRGEFHALCEGDDYWIDPLKLQKQVDVMRKYPNVGFCFCGAKRYYQSENRFDDWNENNVAYKPGIQDGVRFFAQFLCGFGHNHPGNAYRSFIMTASAMVRADLIKLVADEYEIFKWRLRLGDGTLWLGCATKMDGYYIQDHVSVYRISSSGVFQNPMTSLGVHIDGVLVRLYYIMRIWQLDLYECPEEWTAQLVLWVARRLSAPRKVARFARSQFKLRWDTFRSQMRWYLVPFWLCAFFGLYFYPLKNCVLRIALFGMKQNRTWSAHLEQKYKIATR